MVIHCEKVWQSIERDISVNITKEENYQWEKKRGIIFLTVLNSFMVGFLGTTKI